MKTYNKIIYFEKTQTYHLQTSIPSYYAHTDIYSNDRRIN